MAERLRFALDQNFPPLALEVADHFPNAELAPLLSIDPQLCDLDDRTLLISLHQTGWHGLITTNHKMLRVPSTISALVEAKIALFVIQGLADDPLRATGAILLHLPAVLKRVVPGKAQIFRTHPKPPPPEDAQTYSR